MTKLIDLKREPLKEGKLYEYAHDYYLLRELSPKKEDDGREYIEMESSSGQIKKFYGESINYLFPLEDIDETTKTLERKLNFLKNNKPNLSANIRLGLNVIGKENAEHTTEMGTKDLPGPIRRKQK